MKKVVIGAIALLTIAVSAYAYEGLSTQWIDGNKKFCKYSGGTIITIKTYDICPISID
ncbi:MAG: hypothetical protein U9P72_02070 [Campylobacterota bacterium]|nr:hypothetical protein [Campylobacterota bacterium]